MVLSRLYHRLHDRFAYWLWCRPGDPEDPMSGGILGHCIYSAFDEHALGLQPVCTTCKRPRGRDA